MLLGQDRGRAKNGDLTARIDDFERGANGDFGLAVADIAADEPVHRLVVFQVSFNILNRRHLIGRFVIGESVLHLGLPGRVRGKGMACRGFAGGIQFDQFRRHLLHLLFGPLGRPGPVAAVQAGHDRGGFVRADVLLYAVYLIGRNIDFVALGVFQQQVIPLRPVRAFKPRDARVAPDAVRIWTT